MQEPPPKKNRLKLILLIVGGVLVVSCALCSVLVYAVSTSHTTNAAPTATTAPTRAAILPTMKPTSIPTKGVTVKPTAQVVHYPPKTLADLRALAAKGDASAIHEFHSESTGMVGACPQPKREVTVSTSLTGQQLAEDLLAYFYGGQLDSPCGSLVLAYHNQSESGDVYTAGHILFQVTDSSGQVNFDPNATNLKYTLTLDVGSFDSNQESIVTY